MRKPDKNARRALNDINNDTPTVFTIPLTHRKIKMRYIRPYTLECLTKVWSDFEMTAPTEDAPSTLKEAASHPYLPYRQAALYSLNSYWKIRLFAGIRTWIWAQRYSVEQMNEVIRMGKKKLLTMLYAYYESMALTMDTRADWMKMTAKEQDLFRAELISEVERLSSKNTHGPQM